MDSNRIKGWNDYWKIFDKVCNSLLSRNQTEIVNSLGDAQKYVNGLTDGWHEFYNRLDLIIDNNIEIFDEQELCDLIELRNTLNEVLNKK